MWLQRRLHLLYLPKIHMNRSWIAHQRGPLNLKVKLSKMHWCNSHKILNKRVQVWKTTDDTYCKLFSLLWRHLLPDLHCGHTLWMGKGSGLSWWHWEFRCSRSHIYPSRRPGIRNRRPRSLSPPFRWLGHHSLWLRSSRLGTFRILACFLESNVFFL